MNILKQIKTLNQKRDDLFEELLKLNQMIPGTYNLVYCKCGHAGCWCAKEEKGHPFRRITWSENGRSKTKSVKEGDIEWVKDFTGNYRQYRSLKKEIENIEKSINKLLDTKQKQIVEKSRKEKGY